MPLDGRGTQRLAEQRPQLAKGRTTYVYYPHTQAVPAGQAVNVLNRPHTITADVEIPDGGAEGVLLSMGGVDGGFVFFVKDGKLHYTYNYVAADWFRVSSKTSIPSGKTSLRFEFEPTGPPDIAKGKGTPGRAQLYVKRKLVGQTELPYTIPLALGLAAGVCVGRDESSPVCDDYTAPFEFTGTINSVTIDVTGDLIVDDEAAMKAILARQ